MDISTLYRSRRMAIEHSPVPSVAQCQVVSSNVVLRGTLTAFVKQVSSIDEIAKKS